jgi:hypothetical protein
MKEITKEILSYLNQDIEKQGIDPAMLFSNDTDISIYGKQSNTSPTTKGQI